jgi:hypothetical protein
MGRRRLRTIQMGKNGYEYEPEEGIVKALRTADGDGDGVRGRCRVMCGRTNVKKGRGEKGCLD